jgi:hypothetical protein
MWRGAPHWKRIKKLVMVVEVVLLMVVEVVVM